MIYFLSPEQRLECYSAAKQFIADTEQSIAELLSIARARNVSGWQDAVSDKQKEITKVRLSHLQEAARMLESPTPLSLGFVLSDVLSDKSKESIKALLSDLQEVASILKPEELEQYFNLMSLKERAEHIMGEIMYIAEPESRNKGIEADPKARTGSIEITLTKSEIEYAAEVGIRRSIISQFLG